MRALIQQDMQAHNQNDKQLIELMEQDVKNFKV